MAPDDWTSRGYIDALSNGRRVELPPGSALRGRIMRGKEAGEFQDLAADGRRLVFIMGADGLSTLPGMPLLDALSTIGLMPDYVQGRLRQGFSFKLVVFQGGNAAPLATWDATLDQAMAHYPEVAPDIAAHRDALKATPFAAFADRMRPYDLDEIDLGGPSHPAFMSRDRYLELPVDQRLGDPLALRRFLLHEVNLGPLFRGDGYTRLPDGSRSIQEYVIPNGPIEGLREPVVVELF